MWVNINFERRDLSSAQKSDLSTNNFGETFAFNLIKQYVTYFSFILLTQNFFCVPEKLEFKLLLPGTVSFSTSLQRWLIWQRMFISAPLPFCLFPSLICSPTKQPSSKAHNSRMDRYRNAFFYISMLVCS